MTDNLSGINNAIALLNNLYDFFNKSGNIKRFIELKEELLLAKDEKNIFFEENLLLKSRINELENLFTLEITINESDGFYYAKGSKIPYCPSCYMVKHISSPLGVNAHYRNLECPTCHFPHKGDPKKYFPALFTS
jgi:hypothetical protein